MNTGREPEPEEISDIFPQVAETIADALAREIEEVKLTSRLVDDLEAESIDFLDIVFRLEQQFGIRIPRGEIIEEARGALSEEEFEQEGVLTEAGLGRLREYLTEVPADRFRAPMRLADVPRLFTVETFCKVVLRAVAKRGSGAG